MHHCIGFAVACRVKVLDLDFFVPSWNEMSLEDHHGDLFGLPLFVYKDLAENLESLNLLSCNFLVARFKSFRALKNLSLGWVNLTTSVVTALLTNCPVLESLSLKRCWVLDYLDISAPSLTSLVVDKCLNLERVIRVDARTLRFLKYSGTVISLWIEDLRSIVEAVLDFGLKFEFRDREKILRDFLGYNIDSLLHYHDFMMSEPKDVYPCVSTTLKVVEVKGFKGGIDEFLVLGYFIRYGTVLEKWSLLSPRRKTLLVGSVWGLIIAKRLCNCCYFRELPAGWL
ncbi:hypothetical protein RJ639_043144 [Escallonia herrerae]|uniref:F-box/LRR-repeat protein n=1 Tax=Escallonia herrerae TaxID=1293975 RepID=A0AA88WB25_9ASTE|nr:hypothetical protein RJ639_043144 [Escallonia herrerae]